MANDNENTVEVTAYAETAGPMMLQKIRINGVAYEVPVNTWKQMAYNMVKRIFAPKKVGKVMQNAGIDVYVDEGGVE